MKNTLLLVLYFVFCVKTSFGQQDLMQVHALQSTPKTYAVSKSKQPITIDGKDQDSDWNHAPWTDLFADIQGDQFPKPSYQTQVKMLWDEAYLYIYARLEEPHIWGDLTNHDAIIYRNNDFEVFIKPNMRQSGYYEIEVNVLNTIFDLLMTKPYRFGGNALVHWDLKGLKTAIHLEGTPNKPGDTDQYWAVEMAIPFASLRMYGQKPAPNPNDYWQINFSRVQWEHAIQDGTYTRKIENEQLKPENNWVWSPIGVIDMHFPERWSYIQFVDQPSHTLPELPPDYALSKLIWNIHYLQKIHFKQQQQYSAKLNKLPEYQELIQPFIKEYKVELLLNADKNYYQLFLKNKTNPRLSASLDSKGTFL